MAIDCDHHASAGHRVLTNAILLETIFSFIVADEKGEWKAVSAIDYESADSSNSQSYTYYKAAGVIARCAQVNRFWFDEAVPILWRDVSTAGASYHYALTDILEGVQAHRRQIYAKYVEKAYERTSRKSETPHKALVGLTFPRLRSLLVFVDHNDVHFPRIRAPVLEQLIIDPHYESCYPETYFMDQDVTAPILDQIAEFHPGLKILKFIDKAVADPGVLDRFRARMPVLEKFDHRLVLETWVDQFYGTVRNSAT